MTIASAALLLFLILDPLGNIPVFLGLLKACRPHASAGCWRASC
jgi:multiple antibiotic resistance protein